MNIPGFFCFFSEITSMSTFLTVRDNISDLFGIKFVFK